MQNDHMETLGSRNFFNCVNTRRGIEAKKWICLVFSSLDVAQHIQRQIFFLGSSMARQKRLPLSGSEPVCTKAPYSSAGGVKRNNCYAYAIQHFSKKGTPYKLQPGNLSSKKGIDFNLNTCHPALKRVIEDLVATGRGYKEDIEKPCTPGFAKIALMLSKGNDFHFLRQNGDIIYPLEAGDTMDSVATKFNVPLNAVTKVGKTKVRVKDSGVWSHKRGTAYSPTLYNAKGHVIFDPREANLDYGYLNYDKFCSSFCVKQRPCTKKKKTRRVTTNASNTTKKNVSQD